MSIVSNNCKTIFKITLSHAKIKEFTAAEFDSKQEAGFAKTCGQFIVRVYGRTLVGCTGPSFPLCFWYGLKVTAQGVSSDTGEKCIKQQFIEVFLISSVTV